MLFEARYVGDATSYERNYLPVLPIIKYGTSTIPVALRPDTRPSPPTWHGVANDP
jgi:hypothetical protein